MKKSTPIFQERVNPLIFFPQPKIEDSDSKETPLMSTVVTERSEKGCVAIEITGMPKNNSIVSNPEKTLTLSQISKESHMPINEQFFRRLISCGCLSAQMSSSQYLELFMEAVKNPVVRDVINSIGVGINIVFIGQNLLSIEVRRENVEATYAEEMIGADYSKWVIIGASVIMAVNMGLLYRSQLNKEIVEKYGNKITTASTAGFALLQSWFTYSSLVRNSYLTYYVSYPLFFMGLTMGWNQVNPYEAAPEKNVSRYTTLKMLLLALQHGLWVSSTSSLGANSWVSFASYFENFETASTFYAWKDEVLSNYQHVTLALTFMAYLAQHPYFSPLIRKTARNTTNVISGLAAAAYCWANLNAFGSLFITAVTGLKFDEEPPFPEAYLIWTALATAAALLFYFPQVGNIPKLSMESTGISGSVFQNFWRVVACQRRDFVEPELCSFTNICVSKERDAKNQQIDEASQLGPQAIRVTKERAKITVEESKKPAEPQEQTWYEGFTSIFSCCRSRRGAESTVSQEKAASDSPAHSQTASPRGY